MKSSTSRFTAQACLFAFGLTSFAPPAWTCSAFQLNGATALVGKSYDWSQGHGQLLTNARHLKKKALLIPDARPGEGSGEEWTSDYGSLTFHQHGKEFPLGGMNEKGLVVEILWLNTTKYPKADTRPALNELQWIQYQLDKHATVSEVLGDLKNRRIAPIFASVHYLVCDSKPECAVVEFLDGKEAETPPASMLAKALTNSTYKAEAEDLKQFKGFGGTKPVTEATSRSSVLATQLDVPTGVTAVDHAFDLLHQVEQRGFSQWNIVYDAKAQKVSFRKPGEEIRSVEMSTFDFSCKKDKTGKWLDFHTAKKGDVSKAFADFDTAVNTKLVETGTKVLEGSLPEVMLKGIQKKVSAYPGTVSCEE